jgi:hypothetical protein
MNTRIQLKVQLTITGTGGFRSGEIKYLAPYTDPNDPNPTIWHFSCSIAMRETEVRISYRANNEQYGRRSNYGYYIQGGYRILLTYSVENNIEKLVGFYAGSNGGNGQMQFTRRQPGTENANETPTTELARLRRQLQERKEQLQRAKEAAQKPAPATTPDTAAFFAALKNEMDIQAPETATHRKLEERTTSILDTIVVHDSNFVDIMLYDDAVVDNDTVSLFTDSQLVAHRIRVSDKPVPIRIYRPAGARSTLLRMVAENLGSIPPNTALLVLVIRRQRYEVLMKSNEEQNGGILLQWDELK